MNKSEEMVALRVAIQIQELLASFPQRKGGDQGGIMKLTNSGPFRNEGATIKEQTEHPPTISTSKTVGMPTLLFLISVQAMQWD